MNRSAGPSRKKFKSSSRPGSEDKGGETPSKSKSFSSNKWKMDNSRPKGRVMNKRTAGKGKPGMQGSKGRGQGGKSKGQVAKFKFKMSKSKK